MSSSSPGYTQEARRVSMTSPLGEDVLLLTSFQIEEEMSRPFVGVLDILSEKRDIAAADIVGKAVGVTVTLDKESPRYFHGMVSAFESSGLGARGLRRYRAEIAPWPWFLSRTSDLRIFQDKSVKEIVEQIFDDAGFSDYEASLTGTYEKRDYCVQYRESDLDFVQRLLEEEGIFYFFRHEETKHVLVLADDKSAYQDCDEAEVKFSDGQLDEAHIVDWTHRFEFRPGAYAHTDYNFETPATSLMSTTKTIVDLPDATKYELYDYPGLHAKKAQGDPRAKVRMEEQETPFSAASGGSSCVSFMVGGKFKLKLYEPDETQEGTGHVITSVSHHASDDSYTSGKSTGEYWNSFRCIRDDVLFRPRRRTHKPFVEGPQTATVVGPSGEEIYTDKYGRVKVQFHWDREGKKDEKSSCWLRVAQVWAGKQWGAHVWPRIGQEVLVDFLDGDPDRPIIVGAVYNADQMPPYELPANQTRSGIKSRSTKSGTAENFNEIRFEDKKDSEEIYVHAEKDMKRVVENDDVLEVGLVKKNKGDQTITVHNDHSTTVKEGKHTTTVEKGDVLLLVKQGKHTIQVDTGDDMLQVKTGNRTVQVDTGNDTHKVSAGNRSAEISAGNDSTNVAAGKSSVEAMQSIELKVGGNSIKIDQSGITIKGMMVTIEGQMMLECKSVMTTVKGDAMLTLKGGITMIN
jgi:type VI secretion system secreted protein VgrG